MFKNSKEIIEVANEFEDLKKIVNNIAISNTIYITEDYGWFKLLKENRPVEATSTLIKSIKRDGQLVPVIVNSEGYVYDGQHRLESCIYLNIPVKFTIYDNLTLDIIASLDETQKAWTFDNYINLHTQRGKEDYKIIGEYSKKYGLTVNTILGLLTGDLNNTARIEEFKKGELELSFDNWLAVDEFMEFYTKFYTNNKKKLSSKYIFSIFQIWSLKCIDLKRLEKKSSLILDRLLNSGYSYSRVRAKEIILDEYNKKLTTNPIEFTVKKTGAEAIVIFNTNQCEPKYEHLSYFKKKPKK